MKAFFSPPLVVLVLSCIGFTTVSAQVGIGTTTPNSNAVLELQSPGNNQGFLVPRLTTVERNAMGGMTAAEKGLLVFDTDDNKFYYWSGTAWIVIEDSVGTGTVTSVATGAGLTGGPISVTGTISLADNGVTTVKINNNAVTSAKIADGTVATADMADGSVTTAKIADGTIATADLANTSVTDAKLGTGITVSKLTASGTAGQVLTTVGTTTTWAALPDASATNEIQDLSLATNILSLSLDATTVNLAPYLDNTDAQNLALGTRTGTQQPVNISGGTGVTIDVADNDNSPTNEIQNLSLATNTLSLSGDATTVNLAPYLDNTDAQNLALGTRTGTQQPVNISGGTGVTIDVADNDNSPTNEIQDLSLTTNTLSLSGDGTTVNLAPYLDNTDNQDLSLAGNTLSLTGDGTTVSLAGFLDNTDAQNLTLGTRTGTQQPVNISGGAGVTIDVADNDNSATNEIQDLSLSANTLSLSGDATTVNLAPYLDNTDNQDLSLTGNTLSLTGDGTTVNLAGYLDNTDAQTLTFAPATSTLSISTGNSVTVTATGTAGGDLTGSFPNPTVDGLHGRAVAATAPSTGQVLEWNGSAWAPGTDDSGGGGVGGSGASGQIAYWSGGTSITGNSNLLWDEKDNLLGVGVTPKTNLHVGGSHAVTFTVAEAGDYEVKPKDYVIFAPAVTNNVMLPDAAEIPGRLIIIRSMDQDKGVTLRAINGKDMIDGATVLQLFDRTGEFYTVTLISTGTNWLSISKSLK